MDENRLNAEQMEAEIAMEVGEKRSVDAHFLVNLITGYRELLKATKLGFEEGLICVDPKGSGCNYKCCNAFAKFDYE